MQTSDLFTSQTAHFPFSSPLCFNTNTRRGIKQRERSRAAALNIAHVSFKMHTSSSSRNNSKWWDDNIPKLDFSRTLLQGRRERGAESNIDQLAAGASASVCESRSAATRSDISAQLLEALSAAIIIFTPLIPKCFMLKPLLPAGHFNNILHLHVIL